MEVCNIQGTTIRRFTMRKNQLSGKILFLVRFYLFDRAKHHTNITLVFNLFSLVIHENSQTYL